VNHSTATPEPTSRRTLLGARLSAFIVGWMGAVAVGMPASGQSTPEYEVVSVTVRDGVTRSDEFHAAFQPEAALEALRGVLDRQPDRFDALWRAARETVNLGMLTDDEAQARLWYKDAVDFATRAVEIEPDSSLGHQWLAIALGRWALSQSPGDRVDLSVKVRTAALRAIELDDGAAGAHNVLGQWHAEIRRLSGITRFVAERLLGGATFREASWEAAERHLLRAVELEPEALVHRVALAQVYVDIDRVDAARVELREALELTDLSPTDPVTREEARDLLREIGP
jgi:tetratricopeptide (TPR) repeat protein